MKKPSTSLLRSPKSPFTAARYLTEHPTFLFLAGLAQLNEEVRCNFVDVLLSEAVAKEKQPRFPDISNSKLFRAIRYAHSRSCYDDYLGEWARLRDRLLDFLLEKGGREGRDWYLADKHSCSSAFKDVSHYCGIESALLLKELDGNLPARRCPPLKATRTWLRGEPSERDRLIAAAVHMLTVCHQKYAETYVHERLAQLGLNLAPGSIHQIVMRCKKSVLYGGLDMQLALCVRGVEPRLFACVPTLFRQAFRAWQRSILAHEPGTVIYRPRGGTESVATVGLDPTEAHGEKKKRRKAFPVAEAARYLGVSVRTLKRMYDAFRTAGGPAKLDVERFRQGLARAGFRAQGFPSATAVRTSHESVATRRPAPQRARAQPLSPQ